jgi:peptide/nickel transport system ATP-binding protein/oligopeptide transport system ATP-binding protein
MSVILDIKDLRTHFETARGTVRAVDGVDLTIRQGDTLGVVGESGSGKTVLALSIMRLVPSPPGRIVSGSILFDGNDLLRLEEKEMRRVRGKDISMIFQEPMTSLNPVFKIGDQVAEVIRLHQGLSKKAARERAIEMFRLVGMPSPERRVDDYPHQISGGMRQRVMIAMAVSCNPRLMLADEPTTALDVTIQAQILDLIDKLKEEIGTSVMLITHDLGLVAESAQQVIVMYAGTVFEYAPVKDIFAAPCHPYTVGLMASMPRLDGGSGGAVRLNVIPGTVPPLYSLPAGCRFHDRCPFVMDICRKEEPALKEISSGHYVRCWKC